MWKCIYITDNVIESKVGQMAIPNYSETANALRSSRQLSLPLWGPSLFFYIFKGKLIQNTAFLKKK